MKLTNTYQQPTRDQKRAIPYWKLDKESAGSPRCFSPDFELQYVRYVL